MDSTPLGTFKLNFDEASKRNRGPIGLGGAIHNNEGKILGVFWGSLGITTNNVVEMEGLSIGLTWALDMNWTPLILEGDSLLIINMDTRLQEGSTGSKVPNN